MRSCYEAHKEYDKQADGKVQTGTLPAWMHVNGKVAWAVFKGSYRRLPEGWSDFMMKTRSLPTAGPPGDVYVCEPSNHKTDEDTMLTILWVPLKG